MNIKVSIIVPVYNTEEYLPRCLESLVNQSLKEIEIILINDCSTDHSLTILEEYKHKYPEKLTIINLEENKGPGGARNKGMRMAKGEYIGFVDSDDDVSLTMFEELYNLAQKSHYDMVDCSFYHEAFNANMNTTHESALGKLTLKKRRELFMHSGFIWSKIIKRRIIVDNNISFREKAAYEDIDFIRLAFLHCKSICSTDMILYNYRNNPASVTNTYNGSTPIYEKMDALRALVKKFKELGLYSDYIEEFIYFIYKTYVIIVNYAMALKREDINPKLFNDMHDFFFELADGDYKNNKYIPQIREEDRMAAELNNIDYRRLASICCD